MPTSDIPDVWSLQQALRIANKKIDEQKEEIRHLNRLLDAQEGRRREEFVMLDKIHDVFVDHCWYSKGDE